MGSDLRDPLHFALPDAVSVGMRTMDVLKTRQNKIDARLTALSLFLGITIWFLHLNTLNALTSVSCNWGWFSSSIAGMPGLRFVQLIITLVAIVLMLLFIYLPFRIWRRSLTEKPTDAPHLLQDTEKDRRPMIAFIAMLLNCLFFLFVIASLVPMFALNACSPG